MESAENYRYKISTKRMYMIKQKQWFWINLWIKRKGGFHCTYTNSSNQINFPFFPDLPFTRRRYPAYWGNCSREKSLLERMRKVLWRRLLVWWKSSRVMLPGLCPAYFISFISCLFKVFESPDMCLSSGQVQPYGFHWLAIRQACSFTGLTFHDKSFPLRRKSLLRDESFSETKAKVFLDKSWQHLISSFKEATQHLVG